MKKLLTAVLIIVAILSANSQSVNKLKKELGITKEGSESETDNGSELGSEDYDYDSE